MAKGGVGLHACVDVVGASAGAFGFVHDCGQPEGAAADASLSRCRPLSGSARSPGLSPVVISASLFNRLSEEHQAAVQEEADRACAGMSADSLAGYDDGIAQLEALGMTIVSDIDRSAFADRAGGIARAQRKRER